MVECIHPTQLGEYLVIFRISDLSGIWMSDVSLACLRDLPRAGSETPSFQLTSISIPACFRCRDAGIDQLNFHSVQLDYLMLLPMGNTDRNKTKAGNKYEVKPQYEELSKQIPPGSNHAAGHFLEAEICYKTANILAKFLIINTLNLLPEANPNSTLLRRLRLLKTERKPQELLTQKLTLAEERTHRLFSKASKSSSFAFPLPAKYNFSNG
ncbi:hypothetical protein F511_41007 [Dorcoceras hygrometricum]|uniref:Uncharacterized protein n=1 Tax=Dorcoceras hygrometricum TaxID=472368 RepID=A0A2Z7BZN8_9LAMI|nr:hypothetical protein F511_41007 [Dorcoceras hygrometricum]